ncbi:MAG: FAD-dependent thymidylate synthase, partial [Chlamydiota bacterium]
MKSEYEEFSEPQKELLSRYVTTTVGNVFALRNLPEVIKGALFSRYSRSALGLRSLLLKEFIQNEETAFDAIVKPRAAFGPEEAEDQMVATQKAQNFYDRILDGYGDDSIAELGGAHLAIESISMMAAKHIEDCRIGGSPLEKSTRYIYFDQKVEGEYLFYREPVLMASAYRALYINTCNSLFETYSLLIPQLTAIFEEKYPRDPATSKAAYSAALRAKVLDCLRGLLPASTLTNMGIFGNGRFFEQLIHKLHCGSLSELQDIAEKSHKELSKVIPSFIARSDREHRHHRGYEDYFESLQAELKMLSNEHQPRLGKKAAIEGSGVRLIYADSDAPQRVAAALLSSRSHRALQEWQDYANTLNDDELIKIFDSITASRQNRRHKSPRALEHATFTFEIVADFGIYRDLQRHRMLTQERQLLTTEYGYWIPHDLIGTSMEGPYVEAMEKGRAVFEQIAPDFPEEAQYVVPMAYN